MKLKKDINAIRKKAGHGLVEALTRFHHRHLDIEKKLEKKMSTASHINS